MTAASVNRSDTAVRSTCFCLKPETRHWKPNPTTYRRSVNSDYKGQCSTFNGGEDTEKEDGYGRRTPEPHCKAARSNRPWQLICCQLDYICIQLKPKQLGTPVWGFPHWTICRRQTRPKSGRHLPLAAHTKGHIALTLTGKLVHPVNEAFFL